MPYSIIEAFAAGTPVIGTRIGGIPELVIEKQTGFLCEPGEVSSLSDSIIRAIELWNDKQAYSEMRRGCQEYVGHRCSPDRYLHELIELYKETIHAVP